MFNILTIAAPVLSRLTYYFAIYMAVSISKFCIMFDDKSKKVIQYLLLTLYSILYLYTIINGYFNPEEVDFIPYDLNLNFLK